MITVGVEARPCRRLAKGQRVSWTVPSSDGGTLEMAFALADEDKEPLVSATFRVHRRTERSGPAELLKTISMDKTAAPGWAEIVLPWPAHRTPVELIVEAESSYGGEDVTDPVLSSALLAEPVLVPRKIVGKPDLVLFVIDTLRADRVHCYGGASAPNTPEMDKLAADGVRVEHALSASSWTLPAHASLFTSRYVSQHQAGGSQRVLGRDLPTLAEVLRRYGYRTVAVTGGGFVGPPFGIARGFDRYLTIDGHNETALESVQRALALMKRYREEPLFLFFHTFQVHDYYHGIDVPRDSTPPTDPRVFAERYNQRVMATDLAVGALRRGLTELKLADHTSIILTSDHGEVLDDRPVSSEMFHLRFGHGHPYMYEQDVRIPLIVYDPRSQARTRVIETPISLVDVAPSALRLLGLPREASFAGRVIGDPAAKRGRVLVSEDPSYPALALEEGRRKLILRPSGTIRNWWYGIPYPPLALEEAFDLATDPGETRSRIGDRNAFREMLEDAGSSLAEMFPGNLVLRVPPASKSWITASCQSGWRMARVFGGDEGDQVAQVSDMEVGLTRESGSVDVWLVLEPRKLFDSVELIVASDKQRGKPLPLQTKRTLEERVSWEALFARPRASRPSIVGLYASRPRYGGIRFSGPGEEAISRLRSLGYLSMPANRRLPDASSATGTPNSLILLRTFE
jgi:arylsulfatase A-like enzyme